jgi:DNA ligase-1
VKGCQSERVHLLTYKTKVQLEVALKFPRLFKKTSTGADQMWEIETRGNVIITRFGQVGGKIQEIEDVVKEGKNIGRSNETTPVQQAEAEAASQWEKKLKKGYVQNLEDAQQGKVDSVIEGGYFPMLAHKYSERGDSIVFPAYVQPKLDGHRCTAVVADRDVTLWSRTRKPITSMPHIAEALYELFHEFPGKILPDGELYNHDFHNRFEELTHFIRSSAPEPGHEVLEYHIYDINMPGTFEERFNWLRSVFSTHNPTNSPLKLVHTIKVENEDEMMVAFEEFNALGYEGAMVRNAHGEYVERRSVDLQKLKTFMDEEFTVIGVKEGRGKLAGHALFVCQLPPGKDYPNGDTFDAKMKGRLEELKKYYENPNLVIGREVTVKFQGWTKYNKPRFPVVWRFAEKL